MATSKINFLKIVINKIIANSLTKFLIIVKFYKILN